MITEDAIAQCCIRPNTLPCPIKSKLKSQFRFSLHSTVYKYINLIVDIPARLSFNPDRLDAFFKQTRDCLPKGYLER